MPSQLPSTRDNDDFCLRGRQVTRPEDRVDAARAFAPTLPVLCFEALSGSVDSEQRCVQQVVAKAA